MFGLSSIRNLAILIAVGIVGGERAHAGWICIRNESNVPLVIQEIPEKNTRVPGKIVRLLPGEVYREYQPNSGEKRFHLLDLRQPGKPLFSGILKWPKEDVSLRIRSEEKIVRFLPLNSKDQAEPAIVTAVAIRND
jgi:hypothetical protein